ncbi:MAG: hypothetical protein KY410_07915 [Proteobacteria bacterium]|nr:hypothetical protein [Pseudomonadota bacterium]
MVKPFALLLLFFLPWLPPAVAATETQIEIGVLANGAKFIGDSKGGAYVIVADETTGDILAEGRTRGSTGDTERIMRGKGGRHGDISTPDDAVFRGSIALDAPRKVLITATGPLDHPESAAEAEKSLWLIPGEHLLSANRILLELSGYLIEPVDIGIDPDGRGIVRVSLEMLCGCPIQPGGTWDADTINKTATLLGEQGNSAPVPLRYSGEGTVYEARFDSPLPGARFVRIDLAGTRNANTTSRRIPLD